MRPIESRGSPYNVLMVRVGIINVSGYAGLELARILTSHPSATLVAATGRSSVGKTVAELAPQLYDMDLKITPTIEPGVDIIFSALPHSASAAQLEPYIRAGVPTIDLSADFRLKNANEYEQWYGKHPCPDLLEQAVYGLPELYRKQIKDAKLVANPGCFPTGVLLGLLPVLTEGLIERDIICDCKTGTSGAGRGAKIELGFSELTENLKAYGLGGHRHLPEMVNCANSLGAGPDYEISFLPHLVPIARGIFSTIYCTLKPNSAVEATYIASLYQDYYSTSPFVRVLADPPLLKLTRGSNMVFIYPHITNNKLVVLTALDNLVKGAAGQAVQNMNLMFGFDETLGLRGLALHP